MTEKIIVLDTETTNGLEDSILYDLGFMVCDLDGNIYGKYSYVIAETFLDRELMENAFFADKIPMYWEQIKKGERKLVRLETAMKIFRKVVRENNIKKVYAYNVAFDYRTLLNSIRYLTSSKRRYFLPYGLEINDIMELTKPLRKDKEYQAFCKDNGYTTNNGIPQIKAEVVARYYFENDFVESHTGLEDCEIEFQILQKMLNLNPEINTKLW